MSELRPMTPAEMDIVLAKLQGMAPGTPVDLTPDEVAQLKTHLWWKRELHSPAGLAHLFPGLGKKKV